jgi:hypothetical protein
MSHDVDIDDASRDVDNDNDVDDDGACHDHEQPFYHQRHHPSTFFSDVPLHRQMTVTPVMDHVAFADTVLNSPSMASIVIHADNDVMDKHRRRLENVDLVTRIKGV